jgi:glycosyltransferase involved in cell wall biosynthesis
VDDGSTDESRGVIESFGNTIRHEFGPNRGGNPCRNRLLGLATGTWVQFLDADDFLLPEKVAKQMALGSEADVIYGPVLLRYENADLLNDKVSVPDSRADLFTHWLNWQVCQTGAVLWRREAIFKIHGWNESFTCCQDNEICLRGIKAGLNFFYCPDLGAVYRIWTDDTVCRKNPRHLITVKTILLDDMLGWLKSSKLLLPSHIESAGKSYFDLARKICEHDKKWMVEYVEKYKHSGLLNPGNSSVLMRIACLVLGFKNAILIGCFLRSKKNS